MSSGGSQQGTSQQSSTTSNEPPAYLQPALHQAIGDLTADYNAKKAAPAYYPNSTVAPQSAQTQQALTMLGERGAGGSPEYNAASGALGDTLGGRYLDPTSNPEYMRAIAASHQPYLEQFNNQVIPGITSAFEGSGRTASGAHQTAVDNATTSLNRTIGDSDAKAGAAYFDTERNRMMQGIGMAPAIQGAGYQDIAALGQAGEGKDNYAQSKINEDIARYNYGNTGQMDYINHYLASLNAGYPGGTTNSSSFGTQTQPGSGGGFGSIFGPAMSGAGMLMSLAPMLGFSDERLKEDISQPIGATFDGIPIRHWRYKGDPTPHLGVIAQEVERVRPEAVVEHSSGFKMVDHRGLF